MAFGAANVTNNATAHLPLAGNSVSQESGEKPQLHVARIVSRLLAETLRLPRPIILSTIAINTLRLALPLTVFVVLDTALERADYRGLLLAIAGLICAIVAEMQLRLFRDRLFSKFAGRESVELQMRTARRLLNTSCLAAIRLSPAITGNSMRAVGELSRFYSGHARLTLLELPFIALCVLVLGFIGGALVVAPIILTALFVLWPLRSRAILKTNGRELMNRDRERFGLYSQCAQSISTVKALAIEPQLQRRLERMIRDAAPSNYKHILQKNRLASVGQLFETLTFLSLVTAGALMAAEGMLTIGALAATSLIGLLAAQSVRRILKAWEQVEATQMAQKHSDVVMSLPARAAEDEIDISVPAKVQLNGIGMPHDGRPEKDQGINLTVGPGEVIGLVIRYAQQRQTMADILRCRIVPDYGEFLIDGQRISAERDAALQHVMFVDHEPAIFRGTIAENISLFGSVNPATAIELARRLDVEAEIQKLPDGYCTRLEPDRTADVPRDLLVALSLVRIAAIRPRLLMLDTHRLIPSGISMHACEKMIEELRGSTTVVVLERALTGMSGDGRKYRITDWSLEPIDPGHPDTDDGLDAWEAMSND